MGAFGVRFKKRANSPLDIITIVIVITMFAIGSIVMMQVFDDANTDIQGDSTLNSDAKALPNTLYSKYSNVFDNAILMAFVLLTLFVILSVFMLDTHPVFFIISVILLIAVFVIVMLVANVYDDIMLDDDLSSYANEFTYTSWIMSHLLELMVGVGFMVMIAMFIKFKG